MSTLLPTPDAPMMKNTSPSCTSKLTPFNTVLGPKAFFTLRNEIIRASSEDQVAGATDEEVEDDDGERRVDDGASRRPADALRAAERGEAAVTAHHRDSGSVGDALGKADRQVADVHQTHVHERLRVDL